MPALGTPCVLAVLARADTYRDGDTLEVADGFHSDATAAASWASAPRSFQIVRPAAIATVHAGGLQVDAQSAGVRLRWAPPGAAACPIASLGRVPCAAPAALRLNASLNGWDIEVRCQAGAWWRLGGGEMPPAVRVAVLERAGPPHWGRKGSLSFDGGRSLRISPGPPVPGCGAGGAGCLPAVLGPNVNGVSLVDPGLPAAQRLAPVGVLDVTKPPFSADHTGVRDATAALQAAIDFGRKAYLQVHLPGGTYRVTSTLQMVQPSKLFLSTAGTPDCNNMAERYGATPRLVRHCARTAPSVVVGSSRGPPPVIEVPEDAGFTGPVFRLHNPENGAPSMHSTLPAPDSRARTPQRT